MLGPGDCFVMDGLICSFRTAIKTADPQRSGKLIQMGTHLRMQAPSGTHVHHGLIWPFGDALSATYGCQLRIAPLPEGFVYEFIVPPKRRMDDYPPVVTVLREAVSMAMLTRDPMADTPATLIGLFAKAELEVMRWLLDALSDKRHVWTVEPDLVRWSPPARPPPYDKSFPVNVGGTSGTPPTTPRTPNKVIQTVPNPKAALAKRKP